MNTIRFRRPDAVSQMPGSTRRRSPSKPNGFPLRAAPHYGNAPPPQRFNWHALRHFAVSCWIEADFKPKTVQTFACHRSLQATMDRYGHLFKSDDHKAAMDAISESLFNSGA